MQVSYFETGRYYAPSNLRREWPMPAGDYNPEAGLRAFRGRRRCGDETQRENADRGDEPAAHGGVRIDGECGMCCRGFG